MRRAFAYVRLWRRHACVSAPTAMPRAGAGGDMHAGGRRNVRTATSMPLAAEYAQAELCGSCGLRPLARVAAAHPFYRRGAYTSGPCGWNGSRGSPAAFKLSLAAGWIRLPVTSVSAGYLTADCRLLR
ncbi:hypothetical protein [Paenibacillus chitinolyticus]